MFWHTHRHTDVHTQMDTWTHRHTDTHISLQLARFHDLIKEKISPAFPLTVDLELSYSLQVKNKNTWLLSTARQPPYVSFLWVELWLQEPSEHLVPFMKVVFLRVGEWGGGRFTRVKPSFKHTPRPTGGATLGGKDQKAVLSVWYQVQKSGNPVKIMVRFCSLEFNMFFIV